MCNPFFVVWFNRSCSNTFVLRCRYLRCVYLACLFCSIYMHFIASTLNSYYLSAVKHNKWLLWWHCRGDIDSLEFLTFWQIVLLSCGLLVSLHWPVCADLFSVSSVALLFSLHTVRSLAGGFFHWEVFISCSRQICGIPLNNSVRSWPYCVQAPWDNFGSF